MNMAESKSSKGLAATGLGTINCARHNVKLPNGVRDLQKGERYINMDFLFFSTLCHRCLKVLNISYDIMCQWHKNLWARMTMFSFNWSHSVGCTDGEAPERGWSNINPVASSTKEMGPGYWNWKKVINLGN
ncbi:hypothetical protein F4604DRAFT_1881798 [Suillus subluteus]|nr:hypothetical protein F4604DRAFT_1881798 [Suillus subluteus]